MSQERVLIGNGVVGRYIQHHGIKNQKWGVQNGPPYPLSSQDKKNYKEKNAIRAEKLSGRDIKNNARNLTDDDLSSEIKRMQNERTYRQLYEELYGTSAGTRAKRVLARSLTKLGDKAVEAVGDVGKAVAKGYLEELCINLGMPVSKEGKKKNEGDKGQQSSGSSN